MPADGFEELLAAAARAAEQAADEIRAGAPRGKARQLCLEAGGCAYRRSAAQERSQDDRAAQPAQALAVEQRGGTDAGLRERGLRRRRCLQTGTSGLRPRGRTSPARSLAISFTDKAAGELRQRVRCPLMSEGGASTCARTADIHVPRHVRGSCARTPQAGIDPQFAVLFEESEARVLRGFRI